MSVICCNGECERDRVSERDFCTKCGPIVAGKEGWDWITGELTFTPKCDVCEVAIHRDGVLMMENSRRWRCFCCYDRDLDM